MEKHWKILVLISIGSFMAFLDAAVISVAFPSIEASFESTSHAVLAWILDGYFIGFAALLVVGGKLADRFGRRPVFVSGLTLFAVASLVCAVAPSPAILVAGRVLQAAGAAIVVPSGQGLMLAAFPPEKLKTAIGALAAVIGLGSALAPTLGALVVDLADWRWIFYGSFAIGLATLGWALSLLDRDRGQEGAPLPDGVGAALQAGALGLIVLAILKESDWGVVDVRTAAAFTAGLVALGLFLLRCRRHPSPIVELGLFRERNFAVANLSSFIFAVGFFAVTINAVLFLSAVWGYSILEVGLAFLPGSLLGAVCGTLAGRAAEKRGSRPVAVTGGLLAGGGLLLIVASAGAEPNFVRDWLPGSMIYSAGVFIGLTGLVGAALTSAPPAKFALASGINNAARQLGGAIGVALAVAITTEAGVLSTLARAEAAFLVSAGALLAAALLATRLRAPAPASAPEAPVLDVGIAEPLATESRA